MLFAGLQREAGGLRADGEASELQIFEVPHARDLEGTVLLRGPRGLPE